MCGRLNSEIKLQLNNAAGGLLYFTRLHIPETKIKQNCRRSAETKQPTVGSFVLFQFYSIMCDGLNNTHRRTTEKNKRSTVTLYERSGVMWIKTPHSTVQRSMVVCWMNESTGRLLERADVKQASLLAPRTTHLYTMLIIFSWTAMHRCCRIRIPASPSTNSATCRPTGALFCPVAST